MEPLDSQTQFRELEIRLRRDPNLQAVDFSGSFSTFYRWLETHRSDVLQQAEVLATDIRLWRDTQDVLQQLWKRIYQR
ncbi:MAG: hypothetical protein CL610_06540 [Anaerolineaceae bacterium]|nr:hypothetical protein [Anaerolineaceae bacterium]